MSGTSVIVGRLHRIWTQKSDLESQLARGPKQIAGANAQHQATQKALSDHRDLIRSKKMEADRKQLQMREREAKLYDLQVKMNTSKTEREYQTLKDQIAADKQANSVLADEILETLEEIDALEKSTASFIEREQKAKADAGAIETKIAAARVEQEAALERVLAQLTEAEKDLGGDLRTAYNRLTVTLGEDALVKVEEGSCGGCYTRLSPKLLDQLSMGQAIICTSCGRLVFDNAD